MKVVILAGGLGTRLSEETTIKPKPMVEIGDKPILWHIMKIYSYYGFNDFIICLGYKGHYIKKWFSSYRTYNNDFIIDLSNGSVNVLKNHNEDWRVTLVDTGSQTMTGGRIKRIQEHVKDETFMVTYGDGLSNINIKELVDYHRSHGKWATLTAVAPEARFGVLGLEESRITHFKEKADNLGRINGGFFVLEPEVFNYLSDDTTIFEQEPLESLASQGQLMAYQHDGFWKPMDRLNDKIALEALWESDHAPWAVWNRPIETNQTNIEHQKKIIKKAGVKRW